MFLFVYAAVISETTIIEEIFSPDEAMSYYIAESYNFTYPYTLVESNHTKSYIKILIDPCKSKREYCCEGYGEAMCEDNLVVYAGPNLEIAWANNNFAVICNNEFENQPDCGDFIEIHPPGDTEIMNYVRITQLYSSGFHTEFLYTKNITSGHYELWWVHKDRSGYDILYIKPFFIVNA
ncbi:unnamed protein product [Blepharisma stoltei]|uniref:Uncharacterized protein n=1 Tax=Blepharisma stoltei TaxID=1481888 RepID=A0AAU9JPR2_9CILI|nr:unnamed protein product [Blepharisma stoltei]